MLTEDIVVTHHFAKRMRQRRINCDQVADALKATPFRRVRQGTVVDVYVRNNVMVVVDGQTLITCAKKRDRPGRQAASEKRNASRVAAAKRRELIAAAPWENDWGEL